MADTWLTAAQAAELIGCTTRTVRRHAEAGHIATHRATPNGQRKYSQSDTLALAPTTTLEN